MNVNDDNAFDAAAATAEGLSAFPNTAGPKLSFNDKCAAFWCLRVGHKSERVAKMFGISSATISHLKQAIVDKPGRQKRYPEVKREFERLGESAFRDAYYTDDVHTRLMRIKYDAEHAGDDHRLKGPNPRADKYAFDKYGVIETANGSLFRIDFVMDGWFFVDVPDHVGTWLPPSQGGTSRYKGMEIFDEGYYQLDPREVKRKPFFTAPAAHNGLLRYVNDRR